MHSASTETKQLAICHMSFFGGEVVLVCYFKNMGHHPQIPTLIQVTKVQKVQGS